MLKLEHLNPLNNQKVKVVPPACLLKHLIFLQRQVYCSFLLFSIFKYFCVSSQGMFFPQLFGILGEKLVYTIERQYDDPEDLFDDKYLLEVRLEDVFFYFVHYLVLGICN